METKDNIYQDVINLIFKYSEGKELVSWGFNPYCSNEINNSLNISKVYTNNEILKKENQSFISPVELLNSIKEKKPLYIILPNKIYDNEVKQLIKLGLKEYQDFFVLFKKYYYCNKTDLKDENNNEIHLINNNVEVFIQGFGNSVKINDVQMVEGSKLKIVLHGNKNEVNIEDGFFLGPNNSIYMENDNQFVLKKSFRLSDGFTVRMISGSCINVGSFISSGSNLLLDTEKNSIISIGDDVMFSYDVVIQSGDGHAIYDLTNKKIANSNNKLSGSIIIENHVWMGRRCMILGGSKGTEIKEGSIIGAGTVFKGKCPNNVVVAGNPGKVIKENIAWSRKSEDDFTSCGEYIRYTSYL